MPATCPRHGELVAADARPEPAGAQADCGCCRACRYGRPVNEVETVELAAAGQRNGRGAELDIRTRTARLPRSRPDRLR